MVLGSHWYLTMALFSCPHCSWRVKFAEQDLGKRDKCIQCGRAIVFPATLAAKEPELPPAPVRPRGKKGRLLAAWQWTALAAAVGVSLATVLVLSMSRAGPRNTNVFGQVTYMNKPLTGGVISFIGEKGMLRSNIAKDGSYRLDNCPPGPVKATVRHYSTTLEKQQGDKMSWVSKSLIPTKYQDQKSSGLDFTIAGERQEINIDLKD